MVVICLGMSSKNSIACIINESPFRICKTEKIPEDITAKKKDDSERPKRGYSIIRHSKDSDDDKPKKKKRTKKSFDRL